MAEDTEFVAQDQIKAFVDRILRLKGEVKEINADVREIYAEAKGNGFDKTVLGKLVNYVEKRQENSAAVEESESIFDLYLTAYDSAKNKPHVHAREESHHSTTQNTSISGHDEPKSDDEVTAPQSVLKALRADPAMSIVSAGSLKSEPQPAAQAVQGGDSHAEPVASRTNQPVTANEVPAQDSGGNETSSNDDSKPLGKSNAARPASVDAQPNGRGSAGEVGESVVTAGETAPKYGAPGVITWERTPPEGVRRHEFSQAFSDAGQDSAVIEDDLANAASAPIVKIGNEILDGWARYMRARSMDIEYPVVQYDGSDPLIDCIRWNFQGRMLNSEQTFRIAQKLTKLNPKRKADIYAAMELGMELVS